MASEDMLGASCRGLQRPWRPTQSRVAEFEPFGRGPKNHINFFNINFWAPTQNTPFWAPRKKFMCLISWERTQKGTPRNFGPFSATKSLVYCFFPALIWGHRDSESSPGATYPQPPASATYSGIKKCPVFANTSL